MITPARPPGQKSIPIIDHKVIVRLSGYDVDVLTHPAFHPRFQFRFITSTRVEHGRDAGHYRSKVTHDERPFS